MASDTSSLSITRPDDWHLHLRDGDVLARVLPHTAAQFGRAIVMPNLKPPVTTVAQAQAYRLRILAARPDGSRFEPLMTLYLTEQTDPQEIARARSSGIIHGIKWYPAGATTHSEAGVHDIRRCEAVLDAMAAADLPLLVHGEVTDPDVDIFDREKVFIDRFLWPTLARHPGLRIVFEHITTRDAVQAVLAADDRVGATITAHHLLMNRNDMLVGGMRPHHYCLPVLKREIHRTALLDAATSGNRKFFLGTDSAPHPRSAKESSCGCAGIYTAHAALELYAEAFDSVGHLDRLEQFASFNGPDFYRLPRNSERIEIRRRPRRLPSEVDLGGDVLIPLRAGGEVGWTAETL